jgi:hypothetical protein
MPEIDFQQVKIIPGRLSRLLAGKPLGYRQQQAARFPAKSISSKQPIL